MKLGEIISGRAGAAYIAPTKPVTFKISGRNAQGERVIADAQAVLAFVSEDERQEARIAAERLMRSKFPDGNIPSDLLADERVYSLLQKALRDADSVREPFAMTVDELKQYLQQRTALDLINAYEQFCADEFPERIDDATFEDLVEQAEKKSLGALLSSYGREKMLRALPSLVAHYGKSQTEMSGAGMPG